MFVVVTFFFPYPLFVAHRRTARHHLAQSKFFYSARVDGFFGAEKSATPARPLDARRPILVGVAQCFNLLRDSEPLLASGAGKKQRPGAFKTNWNSAIRQTRLALATFFCRFSFSRAAPRTGRFFDLESPGNISSRPTRATIKRLFCRCFVFRSLLRNGKLSIKRKTKKKLKSPIFIPGRFYWRRADVDWTPSDVKRKAAGNETIHLRNLDAV